MNIDKKILSDVGNTIGKDRSFLSGKNKLSKNHLNIEKNFLIVIKLRQQSITPSEMEDSKNSHVLSVGMKRVMDIIQTILSPLMLYGYVPYITRKPTQFQR
jgi:hypothetical protein